jgi:hypothetical protein
MRRLMLIGVLLALAAAAAVGLSAVLDLELESVALLGAAMGAVLALVPDKTLLSRVSGFGAGFVFAWIGYVLRAALLPDATSGRAVAVALVVFACVAVAAISSERIPVWATLLGSGAFAGAYEFTYTVAPPEVASTSVSAATTMVFNVALGLFAGVLAGPKSALAPDTEHQSREVPELASLDDILEPTK